MDGLGRDGECPQQVQREFQGGIQRILSVARPGVSDPDRRSACAKKGRRGKETPCGALFQVKRTLSIHLLVELD